MTGRSQLAYGHLRRRAEAARPYLRFGLSQDSKRGQLSQLGLSDA